MKKHASRILAGSLIVLFSVAAAAQSIEPIKLMPPRTDGGKPLMQALKDRHSSREFSTRSLPLQTLSDLLWAAFGINRPDSGKRTAPSAINWQEVDIYVALSNALYRYAAGPHELTPVLSGDLRSSTGQQPFVREAPVVMIYVADRARMSGVKPADVDFYSAADTGFISQNVYLFCASEGLATVVLNWVDKPQLAKSMKLRDDQKIIFTQPVGYPND
jgi:nitroreductase